MGNSDAEVEWDTVAEAWDEFVDSGAEPTTAPTQRMIELLGICEGDRLLELAAGPGTLASVWSDLVGTHGRVVVSDVADGMVRAARRRCNGLTNTTVASIDAAAIDAPDDSFDVVASRMGLMFVPEPAKAFGEIHRVLATGGRMGVMTWGGLEHNPWMTCVGMAAMANGLVSGGPPVGPGGVFSLGDPATLRTLVEEQGFGGVVVEEHPVVFHADSVDAHISRVSTLAGPLAVALERATPDQVAAVHRTAAELAAPYTSPDGVDLPGLALLVVAHA